MAEGPPPEDFSKLPLEDKLSHKVWKARMMGYEEAAKLFRRIDDEKSSEYNKTCEAVVAGIVTKCLNARPKTKQGGIDVCLMYTEIEQQAVVQEEITKGLTNKQPKIVTACVFVLRTMLTEFGAKVVNMKQLLKSMPSMFEHSDKNVRAEAKLLAVEVYRWMGPPLRGILDKSLKPVQMKELDDEWGKMSGGPALPNRRLRSQQETAAVVSAGGGGGGADSGGDVGGAVGEASDAIDPYDLLDPVDADTKWKERKEVLELVLPLSQSPKITPGDFTELLKALKKVITKDSNVMVVAVAGNIVAGLATGLRKAFQSHAPFVLAGIFEKFKEKKQMVVVALRDAADAAYLSTTLGGIQEQILEALENKNPNVKSETLLFACRCFQQCTAAMLPKASLKAFCPPIIKSADPNVREAAFESIATLLKVVGERPMNLYIEAIDKTKMAKIQEHKEKVELKIKKKKPAASSGGGKGGGGKGGKGGKAGGGGKGKGGKDEAPDPPEPAISSEELDDKANEVLPPGLLARFEDPKWKERLEACEKLKQFVEGLPGDEMQSLLMIKVLARKPGWKDSNFQVDISGQIKSSLIAELSDKNWKVRGEGLTKVQEILAQAKFIQPSLGELPGALKARLGDTNKNHTHVRAACVSCLNVWVTEVTLVPFIEGELLSTALQMENPNLRTELLSWLEEKVPAAKGKLPPEVTAIIPPIYACLEDRNGEARLVHQGKKEPVKPEPESKPSRSREQDKPVSEPDEQPPPPAATAAATKKGKGSATKPKVLKWNFASPRSEHVVQLKEQLQPCLSPDLFAQMCHDDFKQHLKALETLIKAVSGPAPPHKEAAIGSLDLLLRWITLRFFDTNTTVNMKCLEFLPILFQMLTNEGDFRMSDYEGQAFLPYLVTKVHT
ncbi:Cytoskeleton-associated protein 5 [Geodia barretti]|uniref:Cytoskeleton-associated protein 5 n=1 Tax=Geodia barretti TaxID=519541 RepID=A0AA35WD47_GEOBA|nr:Cytoskeleton-associated protein 5 [Geodia barretti]